MKSMGLQIEDPSIYKDSNTNQIHGDFKKAKRLERGGGSCLRSGRQGHRAAYYA